MADNTDMLTTPLKSLEAWTAHFLREPIPVLARTTEELETLRLVNEASDTVDARMINDAVFGDPLMTLRVLAHASQHRRPMQVTEVETVTAAVIVMGITRFFNTFTEAVTVNAILSSVPEALDGLRRVIRRARRAATFAQAMAIHRMDEDIAILCEAALLHDFAEMLLWCHAPELALEIHRRQQADVTLRSAQVQQDVLGIRLADLEQALMRAWHLPEMLIRVTDPRAQAQAQVANVQLAIHVSRHSQDGWSNAALPDDYKAIGTLLNIKPEAAERLIRNLDD